MRKVASMLITLMAAVLAAFGLLTGAAQADAEETSAPASTAATSSETSAAESEPPADPRDGWTDVAVIDGVTYYRLQSSSGPQGLWNPEGGWYVNNTDVIRNVYRYADWFAAHVAPGDKV